MLRAIKIKLYPNKEQELKLHKIYRSEKTDGQLCMKYSIENLLKRY